MCNIRYQVSGQEELLAELQAGQQTAPLSDCAAAAYDRVLASVSAAAMKTFQLRKRPCQVQMPPRAVAEYRQVKQRLAYASRHPMQVSASEPTSLQHQVQGMRKHKGPDHFKATSARLEAACRAGRQCFWTPFKVRKLSQCRVNAQEQLTYMQTLHGTVRARPCPAVPL